MSHALVVGLGAVGARAARQLVETSGVERVLVADRKRDRAERLAGVLGEKAEAVEFRPGEALPAGIQVLLTALPAGVDRPVIEAAVEQGVPAASADDDHDALRGLSRLDGGARERGVTVAAGAGLAPGLADVLARHAATSFDEVDEIRLARTGWAGAASRATVLHARRGEALEWHDGAWRDADHGDEELVWFPDPIGSRDCRVVADGVTLLTEAFPSVPRVSVQLAEPGRRSRFARRRLGDDGDWGAARVEVWGRRGPARDLVVYGVVERTSVAAGTVLAVTAALLAGALEPRLQRPGVAGLGALVEPVPFLAELARRGVRAAVFEGVPVT